MYIAARMAARARGTNRKERANSKESKLAMNKGTRRAANARARVFALCIPSCDLHATPSSWRMLVVRASVQGRQEEAILAARLSCWRIDRTSCEPAVWCVRCDAPYIVSVGALSSRSEVVC